MSEKVKLSKDGNSIDFVQSDSIPTTAKKLRQSPEIEGFYRFIFENDLQKEAYEILERISQARKAKRQLAAKAEKAERASAKAALEKNDKPIKANTKTEVKAESKIDKDKKLEKKSDKKMDKAPISHTAHKGSAKPAKKK